MISALFNPPQSLELTQNNSNPSSVSGFSDTTVRVSTITPCADIIDITQEAPPPAPDIRGVTALSGNSLTGLQYYFVAFLSFLADQVSAIKVIGLKRYLNRHTLSFDFDVKLKGNFVVYVLLTCIALTPFLPGFVLASGALVSTNVYTRFTALADRLEYKPVSVVEALLSMHRKISPIESFALSLVDSTASLVAVLAQQPGPVAIAGVINLYLRTLSRLPQELIDVCRRYISDFNIIPTSSSLPLEHFARLGALLVVTPLLGQLTGGEITLIKVQRIYTETVNQFSKSADMFTAIQSTLKWTLGSAAWMLLGKDLGLSDTPLQQWVSECYDIITENANLNLTLTTMDDPIAYLTHLSYVTELKIQEGKSLTLATKQGLDSPFSQFMSQIRNLNKDCGARLVTMQIRRMPWGIVLQGAPGVGKSYILEPMYEIGSRVVNKPSGTQYIFNRLPTDPFWSGFQPYQYIGVYDDLNATNSKTFPDQRSADLIAVINNLAYVTPQADLPDKGNKPVLFDFVFATCNADPFSKEYFNDPRAAKRRLPVKVIVNLNPDFADEHGCIDKEKAALNPTAVQNFIVYIYSANMPGGYDLHPVMGEKKSLNFIEFMKFVQDDMKNHHKRQNNIVLSKQGTPWCMTCDCLAMCCSEVDHEYSLSRPQPIPECEVVAEVGSHETIKEKTSKLVEAMVAYEFPEYATAITSVSAVIASAALAYHTYNYLAPPSIQTDGMAWNVVSDVPVSDVNKSVTKEAIDSIVSTNTFVLRSRVEVKGEPRDNVNHALLLRNGHFLTVKHALLESKGIILLRPAVHPQPKIKLPFHPIGTIVVTPIGDTDLVIVTVPNFPRGGGCFKHILQYGMYDGPGYANIFTRSDNEDERLSKAHDYSTSRLENKNYPAGFVNKHNILPFPLYPSNCGSVCIGTHDGGRFINAMVCATEGNYQALAVPINQSLLLEALKEVDIVPVSQDCPGTTLPIQPVYEHSAHMYHSQGAPINILGTVKLGQMKKTSCTHSIFYDRLLYAKLEPDRFVLPKFNSPIVDGEYRNDLGPIPVNIRKMCDPKPCLDVDLLRFCEDDLYFDLAHLFPTAIGPVPLDVAINGTVPGSGIVVNTSAGYPHSGTKLQFLTAYEGPLGRTKYVLKPSMDKIFNDLHSLAIQGFTTNPVFTGVLKDEVIAALKAELGKIRLFMSCPMQFSILVRMYYFEFLVQYKKAFASEKSEHCYGVNHCSPAWKAIYDSLNDHKGLSGGLGCGDFSNFDKGMGAQVIMAAFRVINRLMQVSGPVYNVIANDIAYCRCLIRGDLIDTQGNPSGHPLTTIINNFVNKLYHRYAYYSRNGLSAPKFNAVVKLRVYGDDSIFSSSDLRRFNQMVMAEEMARVGVTYTSDKKGDVLTPIVEWEEMSFLGRSFTRPDPNPDALLVVPTLRYESLLRMSAFRSPATTLTDASWALAMSSSLARELSLHKLAKTFTDEMATIESIVEPVDKCTEQNYIDMLLHGDIIVWEEDEDLDILPDLYEQPDQSSNKKKKNRGKHVTGIVPISEQVGTTDFEGHPLENNNVITPPMFHRSQRYNVPVKDSLAYSLQRPVHIATITWAYGSITTGSLNIIPLLFNNPFISDKVANFTLFRGTIHVRIMTNGMKFHYGAGAVGINPLPASWAGRGLDPSYGEAYMYSISQLPGPLLPINPSTNPITELTIPWISATDYGSIATAQAGTNTTGEPLATLHYYLDTLLTSNGANEDVDVTIMAWFGDDLEVIVPTPITILDTAYDTIKTKIMDHEGNNDGVVSSVTTAVGEAAGALAKIPMLESGAKMVQRGMFYATKFASFFGLSRPRENMVIAPYINRPFGNLANTNAMDTSTLLSFDALAGLSPEQSLAIAGSTTDPLAISSIARRPGLYHSFQWLDSQATGTILQRIAVNPSVWYPDSLATTFSGPPISFASWPFDYWRGSLRLTVVIVHSPFLSGRMIVYYSPKGSAFTTYPTNTAWSTIVDLNSPCGRTEFILNIPWSATTHWLKVFHLRESQTSTPGFIYNSLFHNGTLNFVVVNSLRSADGSVDAKVYLALSAGDDFELAVPNDLYETAQITGVSEVVCLNNPFTYDYNTGETLGDVIYLGPTENKPSPTASMSYMGERVFSFRSLIKRVIRVGTLSKVAAASHTVMVLPMPYMWPSYSSTTPTGSNAYAGAVGNGSRFKTPLYTYIMSAFLGVSGSVNHKVAALARNTGSEFNITAHRGVNLYYNIIPATATIDAVQLVVASGNAQGGMVIPAANDHSGWLGSAVTPLVSNPVVDYAVPFYTPRKFCSPAALMLGPTRASTILDDRANMASVVEAHFIETSQRVDFSIYTSAGDDFTVYQFLCVPYYLD